MRKLFLSMIPVILAGTIFCLAYTALGKSLEPLYVFHSLNEETGGVFGHSLSGVPDLNGDALGDVIIAAATEDPDTSPDGAGRVYVFSGRDASIIHTLKSPNEQEGSFFGHSVSGISDIDGDGLGDVIVSAYFETVSGFLKSGRVYVFSGADGTLVHTLVSPNAEKDGSFGNSVSNISDVNGDEVDDVVIGAYSEDMGVILDNSGRAYIFSGATGELLHTLRSPNEITMGYFGHSVSGIPDVNGDEFGDVIIGAHWENSEFGLSQAGRAYIFSGATGELLYSLQSPNGKARGEFGCAVSGISDTNGDGFGDVVIGAVSEDSESGVSGAGMAYIFSGATGALLLSIPSPNEVQYGCFGRAVSGIPDIHGDGFGDVIIGGYHEDPAPSPNNSGRAYIINGADGSNIQAFQSPNEQEDGHFGDSVSFIPDLSGNGLCAILIGARRESSGSSPVDAGRAYVFQSPPCVSSIIRSNPDPSRRSTVNYTVNFSEKVIGVDPTDFSISTTGSIKGTSVTLVKPQNSHNQYLVSVNTGTGNGKLRLLLIDNDSIMDFSGMKLGYPGTGNGDFTSGEVYSINKSTLTVPAGVTLDCAGKTNRDTISFSVDFDKPVKDSFNSSDITVLGSLSETTTISIDGASTQSFTVLVTPADPNANGTIRISITGEVMDVAGNILKVPLISPLCIVRNFPGDTNDDGDINEEELNDVILYFRDLLP